MLLVSGDIVAKSRRKSNTGCVPIASMHAYYYVCSSAQFEVAESLHCAKYGAEFTRSRSILNMPPESAYSFFADFEYASVVDFAYTHIQHLAFCCC